MVNNFLGKKVLIMGLGLHGGAVAVTEWLLKNKAEITVTDLKTAKQLKPSLDKLKKTTYRFRKNIKYTLGRHDLNDFKDQDLIIQNPGVPADSKYLKKARDLKIPIVNEAVMFFGLYPGKVIGVTGTRGKSTTATLIHKILRRQIKYNVVAGNIATNPMLAVLDKLKTNSLPVLELSSWHLEGLANYRVSPHIAVVTNVLRDHLNRYKSFTDYKKAKLAIVKYQSARDVAVLNADNKFSCQFNKHTKAKIYYFSLYKKVKGAYLSKDYIYFNSGKVASKIMPVSDIKLLGQHNLANILAAVTVGKIVGISNENIVKAVSSFKGIDYRFQYKGKINGLIVFNDATSTTPDATIAALQSLPSNSIILIAGGEDKQLNYKSLARQIKKQVSFLVLLSGSASQKLIGELNKIKYPPEKMVTGIKTLKKAWDTALKNSSEQDYYLLFSPAAASFNMFVNEFDRARQFDQLYNDAKKKK